MELTISNLIKILLGVFVFVVVIVGVYFFFKEKVIGFFQGYSYNTTSKLFLGLVR